MKGSLRVFALTLVALVVMPGGHASAAPEAVSFQGNSLTMLIGYSAGGGTDIFGRILAPFLSDNLPGKPNMIIRNMPGADGIIALNSFVKQTKPDGLTFTVGSGTQVDPFTYRIANAQYDLTQFEHIGGAGRTGTVMLIDNKALPRLLDKNQPPVVMGALSAVRSGMMMTLWGGEFLNWNVKWVTGYRGATELQLALSRHEIDMTSIALIDQINEVMRSGEFTLVAQSGMLQGDGLVPRPEFPMSRCSLTKSTERSRTPSRSRPSRIGRRSCWSGNGWRCRQEPRNPSSKPIVRRFTRPFRTQNSVNKPRRWIPVWLK